MADDRVATVVVGKIHISNWVKEEFESRLITLLSTKKKYEQTRGKGAGKFHWTFSNFIENDLAEDKVLFAQLVKIKKQTNETVFDEANWSPAKTIKESPNASYSGFIIVPRKHLVIFQELSSISINIFKQMFSSMYTQLFGFDLSKVWIDPMVEKEQLLVRLRGFDKITNIKIIVTPSNPDAGDYRTLDPLLKDSHIARASLDLSNEEGLNLDGTMVREAINLASEGHGDTRSVTARSGEEEQLIIPKDEIKRLRVPYSDDAAIFAKRLCQTYVNGLHGECA